MDFPAIALLSQLGVDSSTVFAAWVGYQLVKVNRGIQATIQSLDKRVTKIEWEQGKADDIKG